MKMVIVMRTDLNMRKGKMCAQAAHAAVMSTVAGISYSTLDGKNPNFSLPHGDNIRKWFIEGQKKIVVGVDSLEQLYDIRTKAVLTGKMTCHMVTDAGLTEFKGPTITCLALGPDTDENLDPITGELKLL